MSGFRTAVLMFALLFAGFAHASYSFDNSPRASDEELDRMRGGFIVNLNGLEFLMAFSLERLTFINGELVSSVMLNPFALTSLAQLEQMAAGLGADKAGVAEPPVPAQPSVATSAVPVPTVPEAIVQSGGAENVSVATAVVDSATSEALAASATVPLDQSVSGAQTSASSTSSASLSAHSADTTATSDTTAPSVASAAGASPQVTTQGSLTVIQNGPGNTVALPSNISANALTTVIQNSLNDQIIRNVTIMNATIASKMLAAEARLNAILEQGMRGLR